MRICTRVSTGKIIEMQSDATAGTLIANAVAQGIAANDLLEEVVTSAEYRARMAIQNPPPAPIDYSNSDNLDKTLKALALCVAQIGGLTPAQMKTLFKQKWDALP